MGKYTRLGSPEFDMLIDEHMQRIAVAVSSCSAAAEFKALILLGGYGRGEGTPLVQPDGSLSVFNDYDFVIVTRSQTDEVKKACRELERSLSAEIGIPVDFHPYLERKLPQCEFSMLNSEMKNGHMIIWGDKNALDRMPTFPVAEIPLSEGTRLLLNRGKLLLDIRRRLRDGKPLSQTERQTFIKFLFKNHLAFGDCALLAFHRYHISYPEKRNRLKELKGDLPDFEYIAGAFERAVDFKEWGDFSKLSDFDVHAEFERTRQAFLDFFTWYESRRLDCLEDDYERMLPLRGNEGAPYKAAAHNLLYFKQRALTGGLHWFYAHPRLRLYAALPYLLADQPDVKQLARTLNSPHRTIAELENDFYALRARFA